ncbi:MAG TPA: thiolase family protein [Chloroflexia bacterium]|nr:thiolase family protein [Chloroflexia bacterium]
MREVVIIDGVRTPFGTMGESLRDVPAKELGRLVTVEVMKRTGLAPEQVEEVIFGQGGQTSDAPNTARVVALLAGLPISTPGYTVQRNCASGIQALISAAQNIKSGDADVQIVGGVESMSNIPYICREMRYGARLQHAQFVDSLWEGLTDPVCNQLMGLTAENLAVEFGISREDQDTFAVESHKKAFRAQRTGRFQEEIVEVLVPKKAGGRAVASEPVTQDEGIKVSLTPQTLALYPTVFKRDGGTVTPGNSCPLTDGAAALLVMSGDKAQELGQKPLAYVRAYAVTGLAPERMGFGPALAVPKALDKAGIRRQDVGLWEINEAFAAQYLAVEKALELDRTTVNVNGGAIALGHPVGATGIRLLLTLAREMQKKQVQYGVATLCVGGGQGAAVVLERA